jgi:hypothetical protein
MLKDKNPLDGVIRYIATEGWNDALQARVLAHTTPTCEALGVDPASLPTLLEKDVYAMMITVVVEDLMTRPGADGRTLAEAYLKRHGWKQAGFVRRQIQSLGTSTFGMFVITEADPGVALTLRNLLDPEQTVAPLSRELSRVLPPGTPVGARLMQLDGTTMLGGGILPFEPDMLDEATATVGPEDADLAARVTNFWLLKTIEEQRAGGSATEAAPADEY